MQYQLGIGSEPSLERPAGIGQIPKAVEIEGESKLFCSKNCSAIYYNKIRSLTPELYYTYEWKEKLSTITKNYIKNNPEKFAEYSLRGRINSSNNINRKYFSSAGERELLEMIKINFINYHWQSGGGFRIGIDYLNNSDKRQNSHFLYY